MRKTYLIAVLTMGLMFGISACQKQVQVPIPANALSPEDAIVNDVLQAAQAAVLQYEKDVKDPNVNFTPIPQFKAAMQQLQRAYSIAMPMYQAYHEQLKSNPQLLEPIELKSAMQSVATALSQVTTAAVGR